MSAKRRTGQARTLPLELRFTTPSEREVWERLRETLPADAVIIANLRITDEDKDHEADLVVLLPGVGCVVLEVKGGSVWCDEDGWWSRSGGHPARRIHPVDQARDSMYAVRRYVERDPRWGAAGESAGPKRS